MTVQKRLSDVKGVRGVLYRLGQVQARASFAADALANYLRLRVHRNGSRPSITAVVVGRNDDYMSDFKQRLHATVAWNAKYLIDEVVFVEWNPPAQRELLSTELTKRFPNLRAYVVGSEIHNRTCQNDKIPLLEYHAKNVGIRRARSPWVMSTNADAVVGLDAVNTLLSTKLDPNVAWTAERFDIAWREDQQRHLGLGSSLFYRRAIPYRQLGTGEFCLASRELWRRVRGYDEQMVRHRIGCDLRGTAQMLAHGAEIKRVGTVLHLAHPTSCTENVQPHHGEWATIEGVPYHNSDNWGLGDCRETQLAERVWQLE